MFLKTRKYPVTVIYLIKHIKIRFNLISGLAKMLHVIGKIKRLEVWKMWFTTWRECSRKKSCWNIIINSDRKFTLFTQHAESLKSQLNISDDILSPNFHSRLITLLPIKAQIENIGDKVMRINVIHD